MKKCIYLFVLITVLHMTIGCKHKDAKNELSIVNIIDKVEKDGLVCSQALEQFYEDDTNTYFYNCIKSSNVIVEYSDSSEETVESALKDGKIKIEDLDKYNIKYYIVAK